MMLHISVLLLQIVVIILVSRLVGLLFRRFHQPQVIGEMIAGIMLGPSLLGWLSPAVTKAIFPTASLGFLNALSQIGLLIYMFLVGLKLNHEHLQKKGRVAVATSFTSIILSFLLGSLLGYSLYAKYANGHVEVLHFILFISASMSVTAFPVLARIIHERNLVYSRVGILAIACAAIDDVMAWSILAAIVLLINASAKVLPLWIMLPGTLLYVLIMFFGVRRLLGKFVTSYQARGKITQDILAMVLALVMISSLITEMLGIQAIFGAFLLGAIMPKDNGFVQMLTDKLEDLTVVLLLPIFFAFTGLRASIGLVSNVEDWLYCGLIIAVAIIGKFLGSMMVARFAGMSWNEAGALGALLNTRGLMELIILNVGLDMKVITPTIFTMMVIMALVTTCMTTPLLELIYPTHLQQQEDKR